MSLLDHLSTHHPRVFFPDAQSVPEDVLASAHAQDHRGGSRVRTHMHGMDLGRTSIGDGPAGFRDGSGMIQLDQRGFAIDPETGKRATFDS